VLRGRRVVRRFAAHQDRARHTYRLRFGAKGRRRGDYRVSLRIVTRAGKVARATLTSARI
jgi:hypothetical protein